MKILFVIKEIDFADHIAIPYLSAVAKKLGHSTYLCILDNDSLLSVVKNINPDIIAYSVNIVSYEEIIKKKWAEC